VLAKKGGVLQKMKGPVLNGIAPTIGNGKQYLPWIHIDDLCGIYIKAIEDIKMKGAYNAVAPDHKTYITFTRTLASLIRKPFWLPHIPAFLLKIRFGKMSQIMLKGSRISSNKIKAAGYKFLFPSLESAISDLIK
jgi:NAD dependent epimerase/dehydratase family enzyme